MFMLAEVARSLSELNFTVTDHTAIVCGIEKVQGGQTNPAHT